MTDGDEHGFYDQFNSPSTLDLAVILTLGGAGLGCGGYRIKSKNAVEVKRMFVEEKYRNAGVATEILKSLEDDAKHNGFKRVVLETGKRQVAAIKFYERSGYTRIPNYPPYEEMENSVCFEKWL